MRILVYRQSNLIWKKYGNYMRTCALRVGESWVVMNDHCELRPALQYKASAPLPFTFFLTQQISTPRHNPKSTAFSRQLSTNRILKVSYP